MFGFGKKRLIKSAAFAGFVDLHSHVLSGVDDGAASDETSVKLLAAMKAAGWAHVMATPHIMGQIHRNDEQSLRNRFEGHLKPLASDVGLDVDLAAEYMLDEGMLQRLRDEAPLLLMGGEYLLMELPQGGASLLLDEALTRIEAAGYSLILAHPERYGYLSMDDLRELKSRDICFQLNLLSLSPYYGSRVQQRALAMLEEGLFDLAGSDIHSMRMFSAVSKIKVSRAHLRALADIFSANAGIVEL